MFGRLASYAAFNDADRLAHDPATRAAVSRQGQDRPAASASRMGRFETACLTSVANLAALADLSGAWIDRLRSGPPRRLLLCRLPERPLALLRRCSERR